MIGRLVMRGVAWYVRRKIMSRARSAFGASQGSPFPPGFGGAQRGASTPPPHASSADGRHTRRRAKRIDPSVGEYVEFDEIKGRGATSGPDDTTTTTTFVAESQITDVEWEDIR